MEQDSGLFRVAIDFDQSHLFFPNLIHWVLLVLGLAIAVFHGREIVRHVQGSGFFPESGSVDAKRLIGTLVIVVAYFVLMEPVGAIFPNTGLGFLLVSMPFMFFLSLLYVHDLNRKKFLMILANAVIAPAVAWYVLAQLFYITLP